MRRRGVILARQSRTRERSESREGQVEHGQATAERFGVEVIATLIEPPSTSGSKDGGLTRRDFQHLVAMIRGDEADCVVVYKTDRLTRGGMRGWAPLLDAANDAHLDVDHLVLTPDGWKTEFELGIRASMDREEAKKLSDRSKDMHERLARTGRYSGGTRPFGFQANGVDHDQNEADLIRQAAAMRLDGNTWHHIANEWRAAGVVGTNGKAMRPEAIARICASPRTAGLRNHQGRTIPAVWQPIIDQVTWRKMQTEPNGRRWTRRYLLTGFVNCGRCGHPLQAGLTADHNPRFVCPPAAKGGCGRLAVTIAPLTEAVTDALFERLDTADLAEAVAAYHHDSERSELADAIAEDRSYLEELAADYYVRRAISSGQFAAANQAITVRVEANERRLARLAEQAAGFEWVGRGDDLATKWDELLLDQQRGILATYLRLVTVAPVAVRTNGFDRGRIADPARGSGLDWVAF